MKKLIQKLFAQKLASFSQRKGLMRSRKANRKGLAFGFTLIELLVAALIASLLVSVLLSFLVGVLDSDRKETAKSNAQEELQAAISYISDDLQEAIYIYGADALLAINGSTTATQQLPHTQSDLKNECNKSGVNTCTPVLVFWKRYNYSPSSTGKYTKDNTTQKIGCMPYADASTCASTDIAVNPSQTPFGRDTYTYSLVAYYLKNDAALTTNTWSKTARILRWELKDGYPWSCSNGGVLSTATTQLTAPTGCPTTFIQRTNTASTPPTTPPTEDKAYYFIVPDKGFTRPDFASAGTLSTLAGAWKKFENFDFGTNPFTTLVDFMDDTDYNVNQGGNNDSSAATSATAASAIKIPIGKNISLGTGLASTNPNCDDPSVGVGNTNPASATNLTGTVTQRVPAVFNDATNPSGLTSFYACVAPENVTVRIFMRGNAIARLGTPPISKSLRPPSANNITFFPTADVRSFGRSAVGLKRK
jgi:type II secretory pathway pseudopilin PulG